MSEPDRTGPTEREAPKNRIPAFNSIEEEAEFWVTHDSAEFEDEFETVSDVRFVKAKLRG